MKVIISGGGTAGHTHPALAIAEQIAEREKKENVMFVLREGGRENRLIEERGFKTEYIDVAGLKRSLSFKNVTALKKAMVAKERCKRIIEQFKPDLVLGTGGYVCFPLLAAAEKLKVKRVIHESNSTPGLSCRMLAHGCSAVLTSFESTKRYFPRTHVINVGNPLISDFGRLSADECRARLGVPRSDIMVLSVGGSLGSRRLNEVAGAAMQTLCEKYKNLTFIHSLGEKNRDQMRIFESRKFRMVPYIKNMAEHLLACDIVISRCGAVTLSEIALCGKAAILIPSPNVTGNHQYKNARVICDTGAGILLEEDKLTCASLCENITELIENEEKRYDFASGIKRFSHPDAAKDIYETLKRLLAHG